MMQLWRMTTMERSFYHCPARTPELPEEAGLAAVAGSP